MTSESKRIYDAYYGRIWYLKHLKDKRTYNKKYYRKNREQIKSKVHINRREYEKNYSRLYRLNHPGSFKMWHQLNKIKKLNKTESVIG